MSHIGIANASLKAALVVVMQTKDYVYLALVAATAAVFYWHGYLAARSRARKTFVSIFKDSRTLAQMPPADSEETSVPITHRGMRPERRSSRTTKIRAVFGVN
ncbi:MAG TPA: hypothetical protein VK615_13710 [Candidatus Binatia bacterium]|nr:hypothetical protein [Candidatus Binatia bacterium]